MAQCSKCGYEWEARISPEQGGPKACPRCKNRMDVVRRRMYVYVEPAPAAPVSPAPSKAAPVHEERAEAALEARRALDEVLDHAEVEQAPAAPAAAPTMSKADIIAYYADWLSDNGLKFKLDEMNKAFHPVLHEHQEDIAAAYNIQHIPGAFIPYDMLTKPLFASILDIPKYKKNPTITSAITDLTHTAPGRSKAEYGKHRK